jgi:hypothetical protein
MTAHERVDAAGRPVRSGGRFADLAGRVRAAPARLGRVRFVAVDGRAGSGKTTFARRFAKALRAGGAHVAELHVDDLLDGWSDLGGYWNRFERGVLAPLRGGVDGAYRRYDWHRGRFESGWAAVAVPEVLLLEGVGSARAGARPELTLSVFVAAPRDVRLARGMARDGEALRGEWTRWMSLEDAHFAEDRTARAVDLVVDGNPLIDHDPEAEWVDGTCVERGLSEE